MEKLTKREYAHTRRILRILEDAIKKMQPLAESADADSIFPNTTKKALVELLTVRNSTQIRIVARNAEAI
jgi:hypothetical protein